MSWPLRGTSRAAHRITGRWPRPYLVLTRVPSVAGWKAPVSTPGTSRAVRVPGARAASIGPRVRSPSQVSASTWEPMRRNRARAPGVRAHQTSWPWVVATAVRIPAVRRSRPAISARGAAAPNHTRSQPYRRATAAACAVAPGVGSRVRTGWRTTGYGKDSPGPVAAVGAEVRTTTSSGGKRSASSRTKVSMPPCRGGKSLVTISVRARESLIARGCSPRDGR
ncbi:hypothetical protein SVIOM342S_00513 [Streptomyces violaceorubidus]